MEHADLEGKIAELEKKIDRLTRMIVWARRWGYIRILIFYVLPIVLIGWYAVPFIKDARNAMKNWQSMLAPSSAGKLPVAGSPLVEQYLKSSGISVDGLCQQFCPKK